MLAWLKERGAIGGLLSFVPIENMITRQYPLAQVNEALQSHVDLSAMVPVVNH